MPAATRYTAQQGAIVGRNLPHVANRPLYVNNSDLYIAAGDRPLLRLIKRRRVLGAFELCAETDSGPLPLQDCADICMRYRSGHITWELRDARFAGTVTLEAGAPEGQDAALLRLSASQLLTLTWRYGGLALVPGGPFSLDPFSEPGWLDRPFDESLCAGSRAALAGGGFTLANAALWPAEEERVIAGWCSQVDYAVLGGDAPYISGSIQAVPGEDILWGLYLRPAAAPGGPAPDLAAGWQSVLGRSASLSSRVVTSTPDQELDTLMGPVAAEIDGAWYPPLTMHSTVSWNVPFLGWCNRFGNTLGGWHERILAEAAYYAPLQVRDDSKRAMTADPARKLTVAAPDSRFYGRGYMPPHTYFYNMQSQFIDQVIHAWRATGGAELQALLRPMLELHCEWVDECFDPDQDGIYESYINTWPTDSVWYNGGGSVEETCYALRAHQAAAELAEAAGDTAGA